MTTPFDIVRRKRFDGLSPDVLLERKVPESLHDLRVSAATFEIDDDLAAAVNVALAVGAPLLLTGEPGTGKSQLAYFLVHYFGLESVDADTPWQQPFEFSVKSSSVARDVLYTFDMVAYFHDAKDAGGALDKARYIRRGPLWQALATLCGQPPRPAILLIDELDKAPRDFPNDLLKELDQYSFEVAETGERVERPRNVAPPVVIITSNSEKRLPEAFLRRCIYHHIEFTEQTLARAVEARRGRGDFKRLDPRTIQEAQQRFLDLRSQDLAKPPATAEFLTWLTALDARGATLDEVRGRVLPLLSALLKDHDDCKRFA